MQRKNGPFRHFGYPGFAPVLVLSRWAPEKYAVVAKHLMQLHLHHEGMTIQTQLTLVAGLGRVVPAWLLGSGWVEWRY